MHYAVSRVMGRGNHGEKRPLSPAEAEDNERLSGCVDRWHHLKNDSMLYVMDQCP